MKIIITKEIHIGGYVQVKNSQSHQSIVQAAKMDKNGGVMILLTDDGEERWIPVGKLDPIIGIERIDIEGDSSRVIRANFADGFPIRQK